MEAMRLINLEMRHLRMINFDIRLIETLNPSWLSIVEKG